MTANRITAMRKSKNMSQYELAKLLPDDIGRTALSLIENGHVLPDAATLSALCNVFRCEPEDLYYLPTLDPLSHLHIGTTYVD